MKKKSMSPAMTLITHVYENWGHRRGRSRQQAGEAVRQAVNLAIRYGLEFAKNDFSTLAAPRSQSYHDTSIHCGDEQDYSLACGSRRCSGNPTAATSYEHWRKRKPFLICDRGNITPTRVYVGRRIEWYGETLQVTSFNDEEGQFIAVKHAHQTGEFDANPVVGDVDYHLGAYRKVLAISEDGLTITYSSETVENADTSKVVKRVKISHADIAEQKRAAALLADLFRRFNACDKAVQADFRTWMTAKHKHGDPNRLTLKELNLAIEQLPEIPAEAVPA